MKRIVIIGATSGIGLAAAKEFIGRGWKIGAAGRREDRLAALKAIAPEQVETEAIDITDDDAPERFALLIKKLGGMDVYLHCSGVGNQNITLDRRIELDTVTTNVTGFTRMITAAFDWFKQHGGGQIAAISSIAGTKGLGSAPSYSASKRFQNTYIDSLAQLSRMEKLGIRFTDIRPGFVATDLLKDGGGYPMLMEPEMVSKKIVRAILHRKRRIVIDRRYGIMVFFWRLIPEWLWERLDIRTKK